MSESHTKAAIGVGGHVTNPFSLCSKRRKVMRSSAVMGFRMLDFLH